MSKPANYVTTQVAKKTGPHYGEPALKTSSGMNAVPRAHIRLIN